MPESSVIIEGCAIMGIMPIILMFLLFICLISLLICYFIPSIIALSRSHPQKLAIFFLNLFLSWSFVGWVISLVWAVVKYDKN